MRRLNSKSAALRNADGSVRHYTRNGYLYEYMMCADGYVRTKGSPHAPGTLSDELVAGIVARNELLVAGMDMGEQYERAVARGDTDTAAAIASLDAQEGDSRLYAVVRNGLRFREIEESSGSVLDDAQWVALQSLAAARFAQVVGSAMEPA